MRSDLYYENVDGQRDILSKFSEFFSMNQFFVRKIMFKSKPLDKKSMKKLTIVINTKLHSKKFIFDTTDPY